MTSLGQEPLPFKFKWLDEEGRETGFLQKRGRFDGELLVLDDVQIPMEAIIQVETRERIMAITVLTQDGEPAVLGISITQRVADQLKSSLDIARSATWAKWHKEELQKEGRSHAYREEQCPRCTATVILTDLPRTPQLYCHFCDTLTTVDGAEEVPAGERDLKLCDECGMFSQPRKFTIFYFYFLLFVYGWSQRTTWRCPACMRGDAWKMFFGNLPFLIGVPVAVTQLIRSYGGSVGIGPFAGLDAANLKARKGNTLGALEGYRSILERVPHSAGIKFNLGLALLQQNDMPRAAESFRLALEDCGNYVPAYQALSHCYQELGETEKFAELQRMWGNQEKEPQDSGTEDRPTTVT